MRIIYVNELYYEEQFCELLKSEGYFNQENVDNIEYLHKELLNIGDYISYGPYSFDEWFEEYITHIPTPGMVGGHKTIYPIPIKPIPFDQDHYDSIQDHLELCV